MITDNVIIMYTVWGVWKVIWLLWGATMDTDDLEIIPSHRLITNTMVCFS